MRITSLLILALCSSGAYAQNCPPPKGYVGEISSAEGSKTMAYACKNFRLIKEMYSAGKENLINIALKYEEILGRSKDTSCVYGTYGRVRILHSFPLGTMKLPGITGLLNAWTTRVVRETDPMHDYWILHACPEPPPPRMTMIG